MGGEGEALPKSRYAGTRRVALSEAAENRQCPAAGLALVTAVPELRAYSWSPTSPASPAYAITWLRCSRCRRFMISAMW